jgi:nicotinate-nucleotide adenylyltransferase
VKIGVYGGTFNPPHMGHMASAMAAMAALELDKLFFVPAALPPHKALPDGSAEAPARLEMTALMTDGLAANLGRPDDVATLDMELHREGKSYTADTLAQLHAQYPQDELWLLMGSDMFLSLQSWHDLERIISVAGIAAFARNKEGGMEAIYVQAAYLRNSLGARVALVSLPQITEISSTQLRKELAAGGGGTYLWSQVYGYILRNGLYGAKRDMHKLSDEELRAVSYSMIRAVRVRHVQGTEATGAALAQRWGADEAKARRAAILHDCTKYLNCEEQIALCLQYGEELDDLERAEPKLLHAKTGAWIAKDRFGVDDEIFNAIYWHTTGRADMTLLEKVIYLADYMEPGRSFPGVERLRALAETDLDAALLLGFEMSIREMEERELPLHPNTVGARDWLLLQRARTAHT